MRIIAHVSDLHFGRTDATMVAGLHTALSRLTPNLVIISGDFTQRAKVSEFIEARAFLDQLASPWLAVPGNHDIRLYDLYGRFIRPLEGYRRYISETVEPTYSDDELTVVSVNTARSLTFKGGRINRQQVERVCRELRAGAPGAVKLLVAHHPLDLPHTIDQPLARRARMAMAALASGGLDLILSGHLHVSYFWQAADRLRVGGHTAILVQAGTAVSNRSRGEANSFNLITTESNRISVTQYCWSSEKEQFEQCSVANYVRVETGWARDTS